MEIKRQLWCNKTSHANSGANGAYKKKTWSVTKHSDFLGTYLYVGIVMANNFWSVGNPYILPYFHGSGYKVCGRKTK